LGPEFEPQVKDSLATSPRKHTRVARMPAQMCLRKSAPQESTLA
jgi:hypothetical protein